MRPDAADLGSCRMGLGGSGLSGAYGPVDPAETARLLQEAVAAGVRLVELGGRAAGGTAGRPFERALAPLREKVLLLAGAGAARPDRLSESCEALLRRLATDRIDLYCLDLEQADPAVPVEEWAGSLGELVRQGKVVRPCLRGASGEQVRRAQAALPQAVLAVEYSLWERRAEAELLPLARQLGMPVLAGAPLGRGLLTGRLPARFPSADPRARDPRLTTRRLRGERQRLRELASVAASLDLGMGRTALAWLLSQGPDIHPLPSTGDRVHLEMNLSATGIRLPADAERRLSALFPAPSPHRETVLR